MKYLCLAYGDPKKTAAMSKSEVADLMSEIRTYDAELRESGHLLTGESLEWAATTLRSRNGKVVITDGPFLEAKELVGGLVVIEARDLDEAVRVASMHPAARAGENLGWAVELRPIAESCLLAARQRNE
jgi:hypothetical protein